MESTHHFVLKVAPVRDREVQLYLRKIDKHSCNFRSLLSSNNLLDVAIDGVAYKLLLCLSICLLEIGREEHSLHFRVVSLGVDWVSVLRRSRRASDR